MRDGEGLRATIIRYDGDASITKGSWGGGAIGGVNGVVRQGRMHRGEIGHIGHHKVGIV